jgi:hypothetical protein
MSNQSSYLDYIYTLQILAYNFPMSQNILIFYKASIQNFDEKAKVKNITKFLTCNQNRFTLL